jgi:CHAT domain-containing protein
LYLFNASLFASSQDLFDAALLFQNAAVREATARGGAPVVEALTQRATILNKRGDYSQALLDLGEALALIQKIPEGPVKGYERAGIDVLMAEINQAQGHTPRVDGLQNAIAFFSKADPALVPRLHLDLARAHLASHSVSEADEAFVKGIEQLESQQSRLGDEAFKISYFDESWSLFPEMIEFQTSTRRDVPKAFEYAERSRARSLLAVASGQADSRPFGLREIQNVLPDSVVVVYYVTLSDRLLIWTVTHEGSRLIESPIARQDLARLVSRYRADLVEDRQTVSTDRDKLDDALIHPVSAAFGAETTVVFVPDGDLQRLSFATLRDPRTGRYLIEDHPVLTSPSASFFVAGLSRLRRSGPRRIDSALLVGNPASGAAGIELPPLPGAQVEATAAAAFYPRHEVVVGSAATKSRFLQSAPNFDVVHFGGHAFVNVEYPLLSRLSLSPDSHDGAPQSLFAHEISRLRFDRTRLVVLAACSTAVGVVSRGEGVVSVARPFLAAGVPVVIASQWDVDDRATEQLFLAFHRSLVASQDPVIALRNAQLSLLRSERPQLAAPRSWGAFVALGVATH